MHPRLPCFLLAASFACAPAWAVSPSVPPVAAFFADPVMSGAEISPDGRRVLVRNT